MADYSDITFILGSRNDGYACKNLDWQEEQIKKIETCIYSSEKTFPNRKFILLDYNPPKQNKKLSELFFKYKNLKIITLDEQLQIDLDLDNKEPKISFYEFVAKHIGTFFCDTENMIFINQDLIFPETGKQELIQSIRNGEVNLAYRCKVDYNFIDLPIEKIYDVCNWDNPPHIRIYDISGNGDFLGIKKKTYEESGGYLLCHQNWSVDNEIIHRIGLESFELMTTRKDCPLKIVRNYRTFSLDHPEDTHGKIRKRGENFVPISKHIIEKLRTYVTDIVET